MKFVFSASALVVVAWLPTSWAANHTSSSSSSSLPDSLGGSPRVSLEKVSRIARTEVSALYANAADPAHAWEVLLQAEQERLQSSTFNPLYLRRSMRADTTTPFLVCDVEHGRSGQMRKQMVADTLGTNRIMNLYNKDDMSCFALRSTASDVGALPQNFQTFPIVPEMKMPLGTMDAIAEPDFDMGRMEAILCPGDPQDDTTTTFTELEQLVTGSPNGRALRIHNFVQNRASLMGSGADHPHNHHWHRMLENVAPVEEARIATTCDNVMSEARVDSHGDTILFSIPHDFRGTEWRVCLQMLVLDLAMQDDVCFVGAYEDPQIFNDLASGIVQSGSAGSKPLYDVGLDGTGQVVGISDTGIDTDNCYFYDSEQSTPKSALGMVDGPTNPRARKVIQYVSYGDDSDYSNGHGSKYRVLLPVLMAL